ELPAARCGIALMRDRPQITRAGLIKVQILEATDREQVGADANLPGHVAAENHVPTFVQVGIPGVVEGACRAGRLIARGRDVGSVGETIQSTDAAAIAIAQRFAVAMAIEAFDPPPGRAVPAVIDIGVTIAPLEMGPT